MSKKIAALLITLVLVLSFTTAAFAQPKPCAVANSSWYEQVYQQIRGQLDRQLGNFFEKNVLDDLTKQLTVKILAQLNERYQIPPKEESPAPEQNTQPEPVTPKPDPKPEPQPEVEPPTTSTPAKLAAEEARLLELTNQARKEAGLKPLQVNMGLVETARAKSADMVANNYFGHISPNLGSPFDQMGRAKISYRTAGENLAGAPTAEAAHKGLMNSPGHRANVLNSNFTEIGIGMAKGSQYGIIFTQQFIG